MSSSQATKRSGGLTLFSLSGELRNKIYRAYFDELRDAGIFRHSGTHAPATAVRSFLNLFEVSKVVYAETHALFFAEYFPQTHYNLSGLRAIQAFFKLPSEWRNAYHALNFPIHFPKDRGARMRHLPYAFMKAIVHRRIFNVNSGAVVVIATVVDNVGNTEWKFRGNLSRLD